MLINKPTGWTSFDVVNKIRGAIRNYLREHSEESRAKAGKIKVGHAGTLDPLATGLLIICTGKGSLVKSEISMKSYWLKIIT